MKVTLIPTTRPTKTGGTIIKGNLICDVPELATEVAIPYTIWMEVKDGVPSRVSTMLKTSGQYAQETEEGKQKYKKSWSSPYLTGDGVVLRHVADLVPMDELVQLRIKESDENVEITYNITPEGKLEEIERRQLGVISSKTEQALAGIASELMAKAKDESKTSKTEAKSNVEVIAGKLAKK